MSRLIIILICTTVLSCQSTEGIKLSKQENLYECTFIGETDDINTFLGTNYIYDGNVSLSIIGSTLLFSKNKKGLMLYIYDSENDVLHTMKYPSLSTQLPNERNYKIEVLEESEQRIILKIKNKNDKFFTRLKGKFIVIHLLKIDNDRD